MAKRTPKVSPAQRKARILDALTTEPWSLALADRLAVDCDCSQSSIIRAYRSLDVNRDVAAKPKAKAARKRSKALAPKMPAAADDSARGEWLGAVRDVRQGAERDGQWASVVACLKLEGVAQGVDKPPMREVEAMPALEDYESELQATVRSMRKAAVDAGSHVAAGKLVEQEQRWLDEQKARKRAEAERKANMLDDTDIVDRITQTVANYPPALRQDLITRLLAIDGPVH
jgi:hypothetical protein